MELNDYIEKIKQSPRYNGKNFTGNFPNPSALKEKPHQHLNIIIEQAELILNTPQQPISFAETVGTLPTLADIDTLKKLFIHDIRQFATEHQELNLLDNHLHFAQNQLPSYTLFSLLRAKLLPNTYEQHIDMHDQASVLELYSVPFLVRLAIEKKLQAIIGFKSSELKLSDGQTKVTDQFPALKVINFLIHSDLVVSPLPFSELKKLYNWSCAFVHTGKKEYIWMSLKAVSHLNKLFSEDEDRFLGKPICCLSKGVTVNDLQTAINSNTAFSDPNKDKVFEESVQLELSAEEFDYTNKFWDKRNNQSI
ncbi:hypothetical protein MID13_18150 [Vibrio gigantis]|uniref:hypothetical protein n=1 Tax=Vibrio gigantis TaxID=296199 RepID=UPI001EFB5DE7|nr:hypothetical protein [Vibrio gigantis]ULN67040.1 hypothetical protein MID13_18150 [Vibrio gigantis]